MARAGTGACCSPAPCAGKWMPKVEPSPGVLSTVIFPPLCSTIPYTVESPSPVPLPPRLVLKKGSKM